MPVRPSPSSLRPTLIPSHISLCWACSAMLQGREVGMPEACCPGVQHLNFLGNPPAPPHIIVHPPCCQPLFSKEAGHAHSSGCEPQGAHNSTARRNMSGCTIRTDGTHGSRQVRFVEADCGHPSTTSGVSASPHIIRPLRISLRKNVDGTLTGRVQVVVNSSSFTKPGALFLSELND